MNALEPLRRTSLVGIGIATALLAGPTRAQVERTRVEAIGCSAEIGDAVENALDVELSMATPEARAALADGTLRCMLRCDVVGTTAVVVRGSERIEQRIGGSAPGLPRRLAIALAELLEASAPANAAPRAPATTEPVSEPTRAPETSSPVEPSHAGNEWVTRLRASGGLWLGGEPLLALGTLDVGVELAPTTNVALVLGAAGTLGVIDVAAGRLDVRLVSAQASVRLGGAWGPLWIGGGPAARGGAVVWTGTPADPSRAGGRDTTGGWLGIGAVVAAMVSAADTPLRVGIEAEGGGIAFHSEALAHGARAAWIGGGWLEVRLAVDLAID